MRKTIISLAAAWGTVAIFLVFGSSLLSDLSSPLYAGLIFTWLLGTTIIAALAVVHEAEELAHLLGEPLGTLILTLAIVIIEVALISAVMLGPSEATTLGRDTMFAVLMIVLNGVIGLGLLLGGLRHHEQAYNLQGASAYLSVLVPLTVIALVLPNYTTSTADGSLTTVQAVMFSVLTIALYGLFLVLQTGRHKGFFIGPDLGEKSHVAGMDALPPGEHEKPEFKAVATHFVLLVVGIVPIVILSKSLAVVLDHGIDLLGAPLALSGILIAMVVFTPEGLTAMRAIIANDLQRAVNLCLGAATSTLGLTVPAVLGIGMLTGQTVELGLSTANVVLLATTLLLSAITFSGLRTTMLEGAVHLTLFFVFLVLVFSP